MDNPFATRWTRPGQLSFDFPADASLHRCLEQVRDARRLQIVGPHGSGKSTLLRTLLPALADDHWHCELRRIGPRGSCEETIGYGEGPNRLRCVDGWQQLRWPRRAALSWWSRRSAQQPRRLLLVTTHRDLGWPVLMRMRPALDLACRLAERLQAKVPAEQRLGSDVVAQCFERCEGNLRETLFALYDEFERRGRG